MINLGPALKPLLAVLVLASAVAAPVLAEESGTFKEHLLYCEEVVEYDDDFNIFRQYFEACIRPRIDKRWAGIKQARSVN